MILCRGMQRYNSFFSVYGCFMFDIFVIFLQRVIVLHWDLSVMPFLCLFGVISDLQSFWGFFVFLIDLSTREAPGLAPAVCRIGQLHILDVLLFIYFYFIYFASDTTKRKIRSRLVLPWLRSQTHCSGAQQPPGGTVSQDFRQEPVKASLR